ncbi:MAG TPA: PadR family transcriptional regulator [Chloroflexota bacterium]|jgi:PadR family transcriptional regulator PadR|nr:PadR family transcriptional regulator [Chloroflexota bacterium]
MSISSNDTLLHDIFLGFVKVHILHHAALAPVYGLALMQELRRHGYELSPGTLYPVLHGLERAGYLARAPRVVGGKVRKYYTATPAGLAALEEARRRIRELVSEVLEGAGPTSLRAADETACSAEVGPAS